jgi:ribonuclease Z
MFTLAGHQIEAVSVAGVETCFQLPALDLAFDIGRCPDGAERLSTLLLTHGHIDHAAGLPYYVAMRDLVGAPPPRVFAPQEAVEALRDILAAWHRLQGATECEIKPVRPGDEIALGSGHLARAFRSPHRIACCGYTISSRKKKLRPDLAGRSTQEIAALARGGEEVNVTVEQPEICFPGDTLADVIDLEPSVRKARLLLLECSFVGPDVDVAFARRRGHVHLDEIAARADAFENEVILLTHLSRRHRPEDVARALSSLPPRLASRTWALLGGAAVPASRGATA